MLTIQNLTKHYPGSAKAQLAYIPDNPDLFSYLTGIQYLNFIADVFTPLKSL